MSAYAEKLRDPRWQRRRLEIMQRDEFACTLCERTDVTLNVHHSLYRKNTDPWGYRDDELFTCCEKCHKERHQLIDRLLHLIGPSSNVQLKNLIGAAASICGDGNDQLGDTDELLGFCAMAAAWHLEPYWSLFARRVVTEPEHPRAAADLESKLQEQLAAAGIRYRYAR